MKNRFQNSSPVRAHACFRLGGAVLVTAVLAVAALALRGTAFAQDVPYGRALPDAVHHVAFAGVLIVSCDSATLTSATLVNDAWLAQDSSVGVFDRVVDGSLHNCGTEPMLCMMLDGSEAAWIAPGESMLVGPAVGGYEKGCLCRCGNGVVFIRKADCGGDCANCNGQGPCIDPTNHQAAAEFTDCGFGWGPASGN